MDTQNLTAKKAEVPAELLPYIDKKDADAEFLHDLKAGNEDIYVIECQNSPVGAAIAAPGKTSLLYIYIFQAHRRKGYGHAAASLLKLEICTPCTETVMSSCRSGDPAAYALTRHLGFKKEYSSDFMIRSGPRFHLPPLPVRQYRDEDYSAAHALYAEAFHRMRLSTGCFPDSVPEPPSDGMRKYWAETASERLVYEQDGEIIGYAHLVGNEISSVSIKPEFQGKGFGKRFVQYLVNFLLDAGHSETALYCVVGNANARRLYDSLGFLPVYRNDYFQKKA